jgi:hypothetical protein
MLHRGSPTAGTLPVYVQPAPINPEGGGGGPAEEPVEGCDCGGLRLEGWADPAIEGFGKKLRKATKKVGKVYKKVGKAAEKIGKKALPVAAAVAPFVPGVGVVAATALGAVNKAVQTRKEAVAARRAGMAAAYVPTEESYVQNSEEVLATAVPPLVDVAPGSVMRSSSTVENIPKPNAAPKWVLPVVGLGVGLFLWSRRK